ncbi:MAG: hypothetical protein IKJ37_18190 [Kiritimatiellae bacterium]|nr:hypothetical protein [Kiritimatiellia bacterium]
MSSVFRPRGTLPCGNGRVRSPDAPDAAAIAHKGNRKGSTGKLLREYRRIRYPIQENFPASALAVSPPPMRRLAGR